MSTEVNSSGPQEVLPPAGRMDAVACNLHRHLPPLMRNRRFRVSLAVTATAAAVLLSSGCSSVLPERNGIPTPLATAVMGGSSATPIAARTAAPTSQIPVIVLTATPIAAQTNMAPTALPEAGVIVGPRPPAHPPVHPPAQPPPYPPPHAPCAGYAVHIVRRGETLYRIAIHHHTTVERIMQINGIHDPRTVAVGRHLVLAPCDPGAHPPAHPGQRYIVQTGDNLFRIGLRFGVSVESLRAVNGLPDNTIRIGQVLVIP